MPYPSPKLLPSNLIVDGDLENGLKSILHGRMKATGKNHDAMSHLTNYPSLSQLLCDADLLNYLDDFKFKLKVSAVEHLKYVNESDLTEIGMTKPEQRRLLEFKRKLFPASMLGKLKKKVKKAVGNSKEFNLHDRLSNSESCVYTSEQHIIPTGRIVLCQQLGGGEFGEVWQGVWKINSSEKAAIMHKIRHTSIVKFFGVVLEPKNIMLVKISDFGLSRALGAGEEYYRGDLSVSVRLPIA
uniref:non-specific protein-tyrosine kinase n=1 Tax=Romanomermis culicivorax TaxID=13658 RepID=A0A915LCK9_ROMCU